jgi:hypothetical protein
MEPEERASGGDALRTGTLHKIISIRNINNVVPIISNSFRIEQIFRNEKSIADLSSQTSPYTDEDWTIDEQLTKIWAKEIRYPMVDDYNLARVAQYYQVEQDGSDLAKEEYLEFLKMLLLKVNENKEGYEDYVRGHKRDAYTMSFSELVKGLDYFPDNTADSLAVLARMPFPIYITTSYHDFLERALIDENKEPRTQVVFWETGREYDEAITAKHYPDPSFNPTPANPAVYHLFGLENYPGSLVLSEDDYMKFLVSVVSDTDTQKPIVPPRLRRALASSHLLLMGYHLREWDFRVLFRFILNYRQTDMAKQGIFIQLKPKKEDQQLLDYLRRYFNMKKFEIEWKSSDTFVQSLWGVWKGQQP